MRDASAVLSAVAQYTHSDWLAQCCAAAVVAHLSAYVWLPCFCTLCPVLHHDACPAYCVLLTAVPPSCSDPKRSANNIACIQLDKHS